MNKKLYRSKNNMKIAGVCGGVAEYFNSDATIVRLIWVLATLLSFSIGIVVYIVCVFVVPIDPGCIDAEYEEKE